jgi:hypothetical protein
MPWVLDTDGFYTYTPSNGSQASGKTTKIFYVSDSGNNATATVNDPDLPWATIGGATGAWAALSADAPGTNSPNWILCKMGDEWTDDSISGGSQPTWGSSADEPILIASYDPSITATDPSWNAGLAYCVPNPAASVLARPVFSSNGFFFRAQGASDSNTGSLSLFQGGNRMAFVGLDVSTTEGSAIFSILNPTTFMRWEDCYLHGSMGVHTKGGNGLHLHRCVIADNPSSGTLTGGHSLTYIPPTLYDGVAYAAVYVDCVVDNNHNTLFQHNLYNSADDVHFTAGTKDNGIIYMSGCIMSNDESNTQVRGGGIITNSSFLHNAACLVLGSPTDFSTEVTNNVFLDGFVNDDNSAQCIQTLGIGNSYHGVWFGNGPMMWDNNIIAHENSAVDSASPMFMSGAVGNLTWSNNILYKWSQNNPTDISNMMISTPGAVCTVDSITGGSGYTDLSESVTARNTFDYNGTAIAVITVDDMSDIHWGNPDNSDPNYAADHINGSGRVYVDGFGGGWLNLNGNTYKAHPDYDNNTILLAGAVPTTAGTGTGGTVYFPHLKRAFGTTSGSGSGCRADVIVAGGSVVHVHLAESEDDIYGPAFGEPGLNYAAGDTLTTSQTTGQNVLPNGGSPGAWNFTVGAVSSITPSSVKLATTAPTGADAYGNVVDPSGSYINGQSASYPDPSRTAGKYLDLIANTSGSTTQDFIDACRAKRRQSWDDLYTAASLNDYIREGFGKNMIGSEYQTQYGGGGTSPPISNSSIKHGKHRGFPHKHI